ncbi:hypothetical protein I6J18_05995 [Peribacillus psychrosaccharolyticus]|uniref:Uncharacterized protein n=1 Tax=Peribacillus psychrosaccharolyticus TaxID=1407 RepID=A0A974NPJ6_PERPY|nr:hypothetical protein [Peribacillus psychrosaccharolyticus]MEC2053928.1 hypothetical protein [Peribacillus psychrosaccharolyticus]MED3742458.1 hypothetical protein [Peribacillus psychrosaccharolyticus]QQT01418.1 hypothetical protein I6J18_05995 [Peribacillus psychrosaccharolyticus]
MLFRKLDESYLDSLPDNLADKIDFFGQMIVALGNILTVIGIATEATEVAEVEEDVEEDGENNSSTENPVTDSNIGFVLALLGASLITIGDMVSSGGLALEIQLDALNEKKTKQHNEEQEIRFKNLENRVYYLQRDMSALIQKTESLHNEVVFLRNIIYPHLY